MRKYRVFILFIRYPTTVVVRHLHVPIFQHVLLHIAARAAHVVNKLIIKLIRAAMLRKNSAGTLPVLCRPEILAISICL